MPITTRSRATGIVKRVKVEDSVDFSDSVSSYAPKKRVSRGRRPAKDLSLDSEFELSVKDSTSESHSHIAEESSVSDGRAAGGDVASVSSFKSVKKTVRKSRFRSKLSGTGDSPVLVEKLRLFPDSAFETPFETLKDSIRSQISDHAEVVELVNDLSKEFRLKLDKRSEIVNRLLFTLKNHHIMEVYRFANSSFIGISPVKVKEYWDRLTTIAREILA